jgi:GNAT superfamily N-acetyltransferase
MGFYLLKTSSDNPHFHGLVAQLNAHFSPLNGEKDDFYAQYNNLDTLKHVVLAYQNGKPVGCGAVKAFSDAEMEVKRMFVVPELRGQGIASRILTHLENWAIELGYSATVLETLKSETKVVAMYAKNGYEVMPNYGQYEGIETSICMRKTVGLNSSLSNRIFFANNPYPKGHLIKNFVWSGRLDPERGLIFDFHLETEEYYAEDSTQNDEESESDWTAKSVWSNYHACTMSSTNWGASGILVGTKEQKFDFAQILSQPLVANTLPMRELWEDEELVFNLYLLGHDSCAGHKITFLKQYNSHTFDIVWMGKIALTYAGDYEFKYDFKANIKQITFAGIALSEELNLEDNKILLGQCVKNIETFTFEAGKFQLI